MFSSGYDGECDAAHGYNCTKRTISDFYRAFSPAVITDLMLICTRKLASALLTIHYFTIISNLILGHHFHLRHLLLSANPASETLSALKIYQTTIFL